MHSSVLVWRASPFELHMCVKKGLVLQTITMRLGNVLHICTFSSIIVLLSPCLLIEQ